MLFKNMLYKKVTFMVFIVLFIGFSFFISGCGNDGDEKLEETVDKEKTKGKEVDKETEDKNEEKKVEKDEDEGAIESSNELAFEAGWEDIEPFECNSEAPACFESLEDIEGTWVNKEYSWAVIISEDKVEEGYWQSSLTSYYDIIEREKMQGKAILKTVEHNIDETRFGKKDVDPWIEAGEKFLKISYVDDETISIFYEDADEPIELNFEG